MIRRHFLALLSAGGLATATSAAAKPDRATPNGIQLDQITRSIHAHFGGGFRLRSAQVRDGRTVCIIENRGNRLRVARAGSAHWSVEGATPM